MACTRERRDGQSRQSSVLRSPGLARTSTCTAAGKLPDATSQAASRSAQPEYQQQRHCHQQQPRHAGMPTHLRAAAGSGHQVGVDKLDPAPSQHQGHVGSNAHERVHSLHGRRGSEVGWELRWELGGRGHRRALCAAMPGGGHGTARGDQQPFGTCASAIRSSSFARRRSSCRRRRSQVAAPGRASQVLRFRPLCRPSPWPHQWCTPRWPGSRRAR